MTKRRGGAKVAPMTSISAYLETSRRRQSDLAAELGISPGHMHDIINGRRLPGRKLAAHIERVTGVPATSWDIDEVAAK